PELEAPPPLEGGLRAGGLEVALRDSISAWGGFFSALVADRRAERARVNQVGYWVAAEKAKIFARIFPGARFDAPLPEVEVSTPSREEALLALVTGWAMHSGPFTPGMLSNLLGVPAPEMESVLLRLEAGGAVLRGRFREFASGETEWCDRRLLARIHRLTLGKLRRQIEPVTAAQFLGWLVRWQHLAPGTQLAGERGTLEVLRQLQGFEAPANAWEQRILRPRVAHYDPQVLEQLCLVGAIGWGRLSPHPATLEDSGGLGRRVTPSSVAPIAFFVREDAEWMLPQRGKTLDEEARGLGNSAREVLG